VAEEYRSVLADARHAARGDGGSPRRALARLQRELQRIGRRDFFPPAERDEAHAAVRRLAVELAVAER
jgi:hypothetical protein